MFNDNSTDDDGAAGRAQTVRRELHWRGRVLIPGLFDVEHDFRLEPVTSGFHRGESLSGLLAPLFGGLLTQTEQGFVAMNEALKRRVES